MNRRRHILRQPLRRRAFTLVESLAVIVVLAIAVPPAVSMMTDSAKAQADSVTLARATWFATGILEYVMADASSDAPLLGFAAFDDDDAYLNTPGTGLYDRMDSIIAHYNAMGLTQGVTVGPLANASGVVTGDADEDIFRNITVSVTWTTLGGAERTLNIGAMVTEL